MPGKLANDGTGVCLCDREQYSAVIMPHNIYLHSALVLTRKIDRHNPKQVGATQVATCF